MKGEEMEPWMQVALIALWYVCGVVGSAWYFVLEVDLTVSDLPMVLIAGGITGPTFLFVVAWHYLVPEFSNRILLKRLQR
jgi:hypothetical protein